MSEIRINKLKLKNYRSFGKGKEGDGEEFLFPQNYDKPIAIVGYNNSGKTNLMNAIKFGLCDSIREDTFEIKDFHNCNILNSPHFELSFLSKGLGIEKINDNQEYTNTCYIEIENNKIGGAKDYCNCYGSSTQYGKKWNIKQNAQIFYINFHNIKDEISTQKSSWGNLKSFLGKHIKKLVEEDSIMKTRKQDFGEAVKKASQNVLEGKNNEVDETKKGKSKLYEFVQKIENNYNQNLRDNNIEIDFCLPDYEDIFLQMMFKIGLNGSKTNLIPISHFGDGYISMFVMAVIQAIAEEKDNDKCLFLFEEPESFLHENHQEYFYKMVLCGLTKRGHQVVYTTHSDKMIDIFDTKGIIRLELEEYEENGEKYFQTIKKYNKVDDFNSENEAITEDKEIVTIEKYNEFIKTIEPNLNRILFSKKVLLVEGPNDILVYKYCIEKIVEEKIQQRSNIQDKKRRAETYLNFHNISIIPHHGKATAIYLIELCKWFGLDYFVVNDWDFESTELDFETLAGFGTLEEMKQEGIYMSSTKKGMITTNYNLIKSATKEKIHFNIAKLEKVIGYEFEDKNSIKIHKHIADEAFDYKNINLFPQSLINFLEIDQIVENKTVEVSIPKQNVEEVAQNNNTD